MLNPSVGKWYRDVQSGVLFEVIDWDLSERLIEVQFLDGAVEAYDHEAWKELHLEDAEAPEDWRAPFELDDEDKLDPDLPLHPESWENPLTLIEPDAMYGVEEI